jgi:hypothetical protein
MLRYKNNMVTTNPGVQDFNLTGIFRQLAKDDLPRAVELAKGFAAEAPRSNATLAVTRAILDQGQQSRPSTGNRQSTQSITQ